MNILVLFGGKSVEHEVSIVSAYQIMEKMVEYTVFPLYITKNGDTFLMSDINVTDYKDLNHVCKKGHKTIFIKGGIKARKKVKIDMAISCLHGTNGEDGMGSAILDFYDIPYVGSGYIPSGMMQDKSLTKSFLRSYGIKTVDFTEVYDYEFWSSKIDVSYPAIVKPNNLGSSIGICKVNNIDELDKALSNAFKYGEKVIIEPFIEKFREVNCAFIGDYEWQVPSKIEEVIKTKEILDYADKYQTKTTLGKRIIPAIISQRLEKEIKEIGSKIMKYSGCSGVIRIDFMIIDDEVYVNEINSTPGSLAYYLFDDDIIVKLLKLGTKKYYHRNKLLFSYNGNILNGTGKK